MKCLACGSGDIADVREVVKEQSKGMVDVTAIKITIQRSSSVDTSYEDRDYDMFECMRCGYLMLYRRKKELQEITSEDVGSIGDILNPI